MSTQHVVLRLLLDGESHGYALQKRVSDLCHFYPLSNINIYGVLRDLEAEGWATSTSEIHAFRARRVYRITASGEEELRRWIANAPEVDLYPYQADLVALKLLLLPDGEPLELGWVEQVLRKLDERIEEACGKIDGMGASAALPLLTLQWRLDAYRRRREFLVEACRLAESPSRLPA